MESFALQIENARSMMKEGRYREAFELIVDREVQSLSDLLDKIGTLVDIGFILRDEKILRYGLYLLEKHGDEVREVRELAPRYFLNLGHQYANMVTLSSFEDEYYGFFERAEQVSARIAYRRVLSYTGLDDETAFEAHAGLGQMYQSSGRGLEALAAYQEALKIRPGSREILHEKIRLMAEYALDSLPNRIEFLQEARALLDKSIELREDGDDQEDMILKKRLLETGLDRSILESDGEYPVSTVDRGAPEERRYIEYCLRERLYLNLCGFCRRCEFALGDTLALSSSSLSIRQGRKRHFVTLREQYDGMSRRYKAARFRLREIRHDRERDLAYLDRSFFAPASGDGETELFRLASLFREIWSLWDDAASFISLFWGMDEGKGMRSLFYGKGEVREEWRKTRSPSLHAVFDLYADSCVQGDAASVYGLLSRGSRGIREFDSAGLETRCLGLLERMALVLQYLALMHERSESLENNWDFPRPLYNFVSIKKT